MPTYTFKNNITGLDFDEFMGMSEKDQYLKDNPHIIQVPTMFSFVGTPTSVKWRMVQFKNRLN